MIKGKIFICSYAFPPNNQPQSLRWMYFSKELSLKGWAIDVLTATYDESFPSFDRGLTDEFSGYKNVRIFRLPLSLSDGLVGRVLRAKGKRLQQGRRIRSETFKPEKRGLLADCIFLSYGNLDWLFPSSLFFLINRGRLNSYDLIIASNPPIICNIFGYAFKKLRGVPLILDYGDPWSFNPMFQLSAPLRYIAKRVEAKLLEKADKILVTTDEAKEVFIEEFCCISPGKISVIMQGYDYDRYQLKVKGDSGKSERFKLVYTGQLYPTYREPYEFFEAIKRLKDGGNIEVIIAGHVADEMKRYVQKLNIDNKIRFLGHIGHSEAIELQKDSSVLLFFGNKSKYQLPGKIFEYFGAQKPILAICFNGEDAASKLIRKYNRGLLVENQREPILKGIEELYEIWKIGGLKNRFNLQELAGFTWDRQADLMEKVILETINPYSCHLQ